MSKEGFMHKLSPRNAYGMNVGIKVKHLWSCAIVSLLFLCVFSSFAWGYTPPVGIPNPAEFWGGSIDPIEDPVPSESVRCPNWPGAEQSGCYYIDRNHPSATDSGNTYGYPNKPRVTVPDGITMTGGATSGYMKIVGPGPYTDSNTHDITANGSASYPVWIVGVGNPVLRSSGDEPALSVAGTYYFVDGVGMDRSEQGFGFGTPSDHAVFRNAVIAAEGSLATNGSQIYSAGTSAYVSNYLLVYNVKMSGVGQWTTNDNADTHGIKMRNNVNYVWILNNEIFHCQGDSVQTGEASVTGSDAPTHIYIGKNVFYENKENGIDIKDGSDIIMSENVIYNMANSYGDDGAEGIVIHEDADHVYAIGNNVYRCGIGIITTVSTNTWFIGNIVHDMDGFDKPHQSLRSRCRYPFQGRLERRCCQQYDLQLR